MIESRKTTSYWIQVLILTSLAVLMATLIFVADLNTPNEIAIGALYAIVVLYGWVLPGNFSSVYTAMLCSGLLLLSIILNYEEGGHDQAVALNHLISFVVIWICSSLVSIAKRSFQGMERNKQMLDQKIKERTKLLKASETKLRQMTEEVEDYAIILLDSKGNIENWNKGAKRVCGYDEDNILGHHIEKFFTAEDIKLGTPDQMIRKAAKEGRVYSEGWRVRRDGTRYWASNTITALYHMNGTISGFSNVTNDLTKRKLS
ncbi:MAG: PAS domain S-box protein, partial [Chitinophagales bacterium]|nr:PAS domain S-box protein [Chitinophagales bacterium]